MLLGLGLHSDVKYLPTVLLLQTGTNDHGDLMMVGVDMMHDDMLIILYLQRTAQLMTLLSKYLYHSSALV